MTNRRKLTIVTSLSIVVAILALWWEKSQTAYGSLYLPNPSALSARVSENDIASLLALIRVSPMQARRLKEADRRAFLLYVQQACTLIELPSLKDVYLSTTTPVWGLLAANFPVAGSWMKDPSIVSDGRTVSLKMIAPRILTLDPSM